MAVVSNNIALSPAALRTLILMGGDTSALMEAGSEDNPATRGGHMVVRYQAALDQYYRQWHGRALHAINDYATYRRTQLHTLKDTIADAMGAMSLYAPLAWNNVGASLQVASGKVNSTALPDADRRYRMAHAAARTTLASVGAKHGLDRHQVDYADARQLQGAVLDVLASQGATSAEMLGNAVEYSGQVVEVRQSHRAYMEQAAEYASVQAQAAASDRAAKRSGIGSLLGITSSVIGALGK